MKAIFLAAGLSARLGQHTREIPKALIDINGKSLLERQISLFKKCGVSDITIVTGPHHDKFSFSDVSYIRDINHLEHDVLGSLMIASPILNTDVVISYTDIVFDKNVLQPVLDFKGDIGLAVDMKWETAYVGRTQHPIEEAAKVLINNGVIVKIGHDDTRFGKYNKEHVGEFLGLMKLSKKGANVIVDKYSQLIKSHRGPFYEARDMNDAYITDMIQKLIDDGVSVEPIMINGLWCEIDTPQDLERARKKFP